MTKPGFVEKRQAQFKAAVKKALYREKPTAYKQKRKCKCHNKHYHCVTSLGEIKFTVPKGEYEALGWEEPAKSLIKWLDV